MKKWLLVAFNAKYSHTSLSIRSICSYVLKNGYNNISFFEGTINDEYFCEWIYNLTNEQIDRTLRLAKGILERREESIRTLMEALVIIGILMSFAGSSRPASGRRIPALLTNA